MTMRKPFHHTRRVVSAVAAATLLSLSVGGVPTAIAKEPTAEDIARCERETAAYNATWANGWAQTNNQPASQAPPPPIPYVCGPVPDDPTPVETPDAPDAPTINIPELPERDGGTSPTIEPGRPGGGVQQESQIPELISNVGDRPSITPQGNGGNEETSQEAISCESIADRATKMLPGQPRFRYICDIAGAMIYPEQGIPFRLEATSIDKVSFNAMKPATEECTVAFIEGSYLSYKSPYRSERRFVGCLGYREKDKKKSWSREYSFTASNVISQRLYQKLGVKGNSLDFPDDAVVELVFEVRKDVTGPDQSIGTNYARTKLNGGQENQVDIEMPKESGSYFAKVKAISITIKSWGFSPVPFGVDEELGRQKCNKWNSNGDGGTCIFKDYA